MKKLFRRDKPELELTLYMDKFRILLVLPLQIFLCSAITHLEKTLQLHSVQKTLN